MGAGVAIERRIGPALGDNFREFTRRGLPVGVEAVAEFYGLFVASAACGRARGEDFHAPTPRRSFRSFKAPEAGGFGLLCDRIVLREWGDVAGESLVGVRRDKRDKKGRFDQIWS